MRHHLISSSLQGQSRQDNLSQLEKHHTPQPNMLRGQHYTRYCGEGSGAFMEFLNISQKSGKSLQVMKK